MSSSIQKLGTDPEKAFPYKAFQDEIKKMGGFGFLVSMMTLPFFSSHIDDNPDFDLLSEMACQGEVVDFTKWSSSKSIAIYNERMLGVFRDCEKFGYI